MSAFESVHRARHSARQLLDQLQARLTPAAEQFGQTLKPVQRMAETGTVALGWLPASVQAAALEPVLNHVLAELIAAGEFEFLTGRCCAIAVLDRDQAWHLGFDGSRLRLQSAQTPDVTIAATVPAFLQLISQSVDPDTLFFQRQLTIEGDVEMGLYVKNMLDALDEDDLPPLWRRALAALRQLIRLETPRAD